MLNKPICVMFAGQPRAIHLATAKQGGAYHIYYVESWGNYTVATVDSGLPALAKQVFQQVCGMQAMALANVKV